MLMDLGNLSISPSMYKLSFDIIRDIAPVTTVTFSPYLLTTHPNVPVKTVADLIALARKNPGKLNVPVGLGSTIHLSTIALRAARGREVDLRSDQGRPELGLSVMPAEMDTRQYPGWLG